MRFFLAICATLALAACNPATQPERTESAPRVCEQVAHGGAYVQFRCSGGTFMSALTAYEQQYNVKADVVFVMSTDVYGRPISYGVRFVYNAP